MVRKRTGAPRGRPSGDVAEETAGGRLYSLRKKAGWSQEVAGERLGLDRSMISKIEHGRHNVDADLAERAAKLFGVSPSYIQFGEGRVRRVPLISWVTAGRLADPASQLSEETESIEISGLDPGDYFATKVRGDSMDRISPEGSTIIVNRAEKDPLPGRRYIFARRGETTYKRYESDPYVRLEPDSTNPQNQAIFPQGEETWHVIGRVRLTILEL